jgi:hypothetical protein
MKQFITLFLLSFLSLYTSAQIGLPIQQSVLPKNSLIVNYDFSKSTGFTRGANTATNLAGTASGNSTVYNSPIFMNSLGFIILNGTNQYVMSPNLRTYFKSVNSTVQKSFTMSLWIYPTGLNGVIVSEHESQTLNSGFFTSNIELVNGYIKYKVWDVTPITSSLITLNKWYHVSMVYDGATLKGYLNGISQGSETYDRIIPSSSQNYGIGSPSTKNMGSGVYGNFHLSQFKIHNLPLTDKEILQEYESRKDEFDYTIHSPSTNSNPTYWGISSAWVGETTFSQDHFTPWLNNIRLGWAASANDANQWITLNYDEPAYIKGVVIQPRANSGNQYVTKVHVETSLTGAAPWTRVVSDVSLGTNNTDDARVLFPTTVFAKSVKVIPVTWTNHITMRLGLLVKPNQTFTTDKLVLHYNPSMTESYSGTGTSLVDIAGNGLTGTMSNLSYTNPAFTFNGSSSQVNIPDNAALEPGTGSWTIEVWFNNAGSSGTVLGKYNNGGASANISYALRLAASNLIRADFSNGTTAQVTDNYTFNANTWVQMVYVWDKTNNNIYTYSNGALKQTKAINISGGILNASTNLYLGSYNGGEYSQYFNGKMGIVRLYKKALSATEVLKNYDASKSNYGIIQNGLVMNLATAPSSGSTWTDMSGNGNNATLVSSPSYTASNGGGITTASSAYISTGYNLPNTFTISMAASFNPTNYWATIWGNESWTAQKGYIAYFKNANNIDIGSPSGEVTVPINDYNTVHIWDFTVNGTDFILYKDGVIFGTGTFTSPVSGVSSNGLYFGARHTNGGTGAQDFGPGTYYSMRVYNRRLSADEIKTNFSFLRSSFGL